MMIIIITIIMIIIIIIITLNFPKLLLDGTRQKTSIVVSHQISVVHYYYDQQNHSVKLKKKITHYTSKNPPKI